MSEPDRRSPERRFSSTRDSVAVLHVRRFRLLFWATAASRLGDDIVPVALAFAVIQLDGSAGALGIVLAARIAPNIALTLAGGVIADRLSRSRIMATTDLVRMASQTLAAVLLLTGSATIALLALLQVVHGAASALFGPTSGAVVPDTLPDQSLLQRANALLALLRSASSVAGPLVAGILVAATSPGWAFAIDALSFAVSAAFLIRLRLPAVTEAGERSHFLRDLRDGWQAVTSRRWLFVSLAQAGVFHLSFLATFFVLGPFVAESSYSGSGSWSLIVAGFGTGSVLGGVAALRWVVARPLLAGNLALLACVPSLVAMATTPPLALTVAAQVPAGFGVMFFDALWLTAMQRHVPSGLLSRVSSYDYLLSTALWPLGLVIVGPVADAVGFDATLLGAAAITAAIIVAALAVREIRTMQAAVPAPSPDSA